MVRFVLALLALFVLSGCSPSMSTGQAGEKALYLFCTANRTNNEVLDAFFQEDLKGLKLATSAREEIYAEQYRAFSDTEQWPAAVRPEVEEFASQTLIELNNLNRVGAAVRETETFEEALMAVDSTLRRSDRAVTARLNELSTAIRVKLNLSLDRESSCVGY